MKVCAFIFHNGLWWLVEQHIACTSEFDIFATERRRELRDCRRVFQRNQPLSLTKHFVNSGALALELGLWGLGLRTLFMFQMNCHGSSIQYCRDCTTGWLYNIHTHTLTVWSDCLSTISLSILSRLCKCLSLRLLV